MDIIPAHDFLKKFYDFGMIEHWAFTFNITIKDMDQAVRYPYVCICFL